MYSSKGLTQTTYLCFISIGNTTVLQLAMSSLCAFLFYWRHECRWLWCRFDFNTT